ncbi:MAG: hypothetical protein V2A54_01335 [Bacteroidota bacterium]
MKKVVVSLFLVSILAMLVASCKTHERCPAYGKAPDTKTEKRV